MKIGQVPETRIITPVAYAVVPDKGVRKCNRRRRYDQPDDADGDKVEAAASVVVAAVVGAHNVFFAFISIVTHRD